MTDTPDPSIVLRIEIEENDEHLARLKEYFDLTDKEIALLKELPRGIFAERYGNKTPSEPTEDHAHWRYQEYLENTPAIKVFHRLSDYESVGVPETSSQRLAASEIIDKLERLSGPINISTGEMPMMLVGAKSTAMQKMLEHYSPSSPTQDTREAHKQRLLAECGKLNPPFDYRTLTPFAVRPKPVEVNPHEGRGIRDEWLMYARYARPTSGKTVLKLHRLLSMSYTNRSFLQKPELTNRDNDFGPPAHFGAIDVAKIRRSDRRVQTPKTPRS